MSSYAVLEAPLTPAEIKDTHGWINVVVPIDLADLTSEDQNWLLGEFSRLAVGGPELECIDYDLVGFQGAELHFHVTGDASRCLNGAFTVLQGVLDALSPKHEEVLDHLVHDIAARQAADVNNDGPKAQVAYLMAQGMTADDILSKLQKA